MDDKAVLAIVGLIFTIINVYIASNQRGKVDGQQLARIEVNGLNVSAKMDEMKGEINLMKKDAGESKEFRVKYEDSIKDLVKFKAEQIVINTKRDNAMQKLTEKLEEVNEKLDRLLEKKSSE